MSKKKLAIFTASLIVSSAGVGYASYETTKNTVEVTLDGKEKTIRTHASTVEDLFEEMNLSLRSEDYLYPAKNTKIKNDLEVKWEPAKQVQIDNENEKKTIWTTADTVGELLKEQRISLNKYDKVDPKAGAKITDDMQVAIQKAFSLMLINGGKKEEVWSTSTTVADFLTQQGIELKKLDRVEPNTDEYIKANAVVKVIRVEKVTDVVEEPIDYAVVTKKDGSLSKGTEKVVKSGREGLVSKKYEVILENGKEVSRKLIKEKTLKEKQNKVVAVGTKESSQTVSRGTGNVRKEFYVTSTAYTANCNGCSGMTATGINLRANPNMKVIAVDPSIIPLGTKVYVEGYGYAVAADTGSAIKGNKIDVFVSSKSEAYRWGRRTVKIKILN